MNRPEGLHRRIRAQPGPRRRDRVADAGPDGGHAVCHTREAALDRRGRRLRRDADTLDEAGQMDKGLAHIGHRSLVMLALPVDRLANVAQPVRDDTGPRGSGFDGVKLAAQPAEILPQRIESRRGLVDGQAGARRRDRLVDPPFDRDEARLHRVETVREIAGGHRQRPAFGGHEDRVDGTGHFRAAGF